MRPRPHPDLLVDGSSPKELVVNEDRRPIDAAREMKLASSIAKGPRFGHGPFSSVFIYVILCGTSFEPLRPIGLTSTLAEESTEVAGRTP